MTWSKSRNSLNYSTSIFDNFWIFQTETWAVCTVLRESRKSGLFDVGSVVTELLHILLSKRQKKADFFLKYWVLSKKLQRKKGICITWLPIRLGRPGLVMISKKRGSDFPLLGCYKKLLQKLVKSRCGKTAELVRKYE